MAKSCFVIQGFGKKQDYAQGKTFDLDASYAVIKEAMEGAGLECCRADELRANAVIDQVMYDQLLTADLVVADITALNFNAAYELGVRFALRPYATLVVGEGGMSFPFDVNHIYIHSYQHLGADIGHREAVRFGKELRELAKKAVDSVQRDSPVYTFLRQLPEYGFLSHARQPQAQRGSEDGGVSIRELIDQARGAMRESRFTDAVELWRKVRDLVGKDDYVVQQLALATYKSEKPDPEAALRDAKGVLEYLQPGGSFDVETLGLWASVHKKLFEITGNTASLEEALFALERGFFIKQDYYNGINLSFLLDVKASASPADQKEELRGVARYVRRKVKGICTQALSDKNVGADEKYWILATLHEACTGLGEQDEATRWKEDAGKLASASWMRTATEKQIEKLRALLS